MGKGFSYVSFIFGPHYCALRKAVHQLINFLSDTAKLAIWKTRKNRVRGQGSERYGVHDYKMTEQTEVI